MKLPITDKFLWDVYNALDKAGDIIGFLTRPPTMANYLSVPRNPIFDKYRKELGGVKFSKLIYRLKRNNYIKVESLKKKNVIIITKKGVSRTLKASFKTEKRIKRKDGKWVMLIFDIPEKYKKSRSLLAGVLNNLDYKMFQQSVWITPYDVSDKTERLLQFYSLDKFVRIFLLEEL